MSEFRSMFNIAVVLLFYYVIAGFLIAIGMNPVHATLIVDVMAVMFVILWRDYIKYNYTPRDNKGEFSLFSMFFVVFIFGQLTGTMFEKLFGPGSFAHYQDTLRSDVPFAVFLMLIVAPIAEEYLVRGFIYEQLCRGWGFRLAWIGQAVIFAVMHGTLVHAIPTFLTGLFLALVYERTGDLAWSIGFHMAYNLLALTVGGSSVPEFLCMPWVAITLDILCVFVLWVMYSNTINNKLVVAIYHKAKPMGVAHLAPRGVEKREEGSYGSQEDQEEAND